MDGKRAAPLAGRRVVFAGIRFLCRAGPMCPAAGYAFFGGARGPRPTGRYVEPRVGDAVPSARQRRAARPPLGGGCRRSRLGERKTVWHLSLRQRFALTPPSQREVRGNGFPRQCLHWLGMTALRAVWADRVPGGGARGPRPTGRYVEPRETGRRGRRPLRNDGNGRTESSARVHSPRCIFSSVSRRMAARSSVR